MPYNNREAKSDKSGSLHRGLGVFLLLGAITLFMGRMPADAKKPFDLDSSLYRGYPKRFDGWGKIHRIGPNEIVIDDAVYNITQRTTYHTPRLKNTTKSVFAVGQTVGFIRNLDGDIESLWRIIIKR
jgi:hypothetical protein